MLLPLAIACLACAALPATLTLLNLREYQPPLPLPLDEAGTAPASIAVCVPARNEAEGIAACLQAVLGSASVALQVLVIDDHSADGTAAIVQHMAERDGRLVLLPSPALPPGWNGKQHACWVGAQRATAPLLCFLDADVRLHPDALARMAATLRSSAIGAAPRAALLSGFPQEETGTLLEWLLLPLIHFVLLGLLPMRLLRTTTVPAFAAGCGQFLLVDREAYAASGGHAAIRHTMHDGLLLPRLLRTHGYGTRLADLTDLARCRMYRSAAATWNGLAKNATEGMAAPGTVVPVSLLLGLGQVLPVPVLLVALLRGSPAAVACAWGAVVLSYLPRLLEVRRFRQRGVSAALHPAGVAVLLVLQWYALARKLLRRPAQWKAREYRAN